MLGWRRYLSIEEDFLRARYYVAFDVEYAHSDFLSKSVILLGAEIEASFKNLCSLIDNKAPRGNICQYKSILLKALPNIGNFKSILREDTERNYLPFKDWDKGSLFWWDVYNNIKHSSDDKTATMKVAMTMLSAYQLLIILIAAYEERDFDDRIAYTQLDIPRLLIPDVAMGMYQQDDDEGLVSFGFSASELKEKLKKIVNI